MKSIWKFKDGMIKVLLLATLALIAFSFTNGLAEGDSAIDISRPIKYQIFQRNENNIGKIRIAGEYSGGPNSVLASFDGGDRVIIDNSPSNGEFSGYMEVPSGQGELVVSFGDQEVSDSVEEVGVGDIFVIAGQSNAVMQGEDFNEYESPSDFPDLDAVAYDVNDVYWENANDPLHSQEDHGSPFLTEDDVPHDTGSSWPLVASKIMENQHVPVGFICTAWGGTSVLEWLPSASPNFEDYHGVSMYARMVRTLRRATDNINKVRGVIWFQGEADTRLNHGARGYEGYKSALAELIDSLEDNVIEGGFEFYIGQIGPPNRGYINEVREAQMDLWFEHEKAYPGAVTYDILTTSVSGDIHFGTDRAIREVAERWWLALRQTYGYGDGTGPLLENAVTYVTGVGRKILVRFDRPLDTSLPLDKDPWTVRSDGEIVGIDSVGYNDPRTVSLELSQNNAENLEVSLGELTKAEGESVPATEDKCSIDNTPGGMVANVFYNRDVERISMEDAKNIEVTDISISPEEARPNENVHLTLQLTNDGWLEDSKEIPIRVGEEIITSRNVTISPTGGDKISLTFSRGTPGNYKVRAGGTSENFIVLRPAEFEITDLTLSDNEVQVDENINVSVQVKNSGGEEGTKTVELSCDGETRTQEVTLSPDESRTVQFTLSEDEPGSYDVSVGSLSRSFEVVKPEEGKPGKGGGIPTLPIIAGVIAVIVVIGAVIYWRR